MKNIIYIILVCISAVLSTACSDQFLQDKRDYNNLITEDVFKDKTQATAVLGTIYSQILGSYNAPVCGSDPLMRQAQATGGFQYFLTEEIPSGYAGSGISIVSDGRYNGNNDKTTKAGNHIANPTYWNDPRDNATNYNNYTRKTLFPNIFLINAYITEIDRTGRQQIKDDAFWDKLKGQAIFARAWLYFDAIRLWGGVPYYNTETDQAVNGDRSARMSIPDCIEKICTDFKKAADLLPAKWESTDDGRFTSVGALAMISRVRLYAASPVFNASWDNTASKRWQAALDASLAAEQAANTAGYGTSITSIDTWDKAFYTYASGSFNPEAIIKVPKSDVTTTGVFNVWENYIRPGAARTNGTYSGIPAPEQMITLFPMKDGSRPTVANGYDDAKFYRNRDPRFYRTFAFSGCQWPINGSTLSSNPQIWLYAYKYNSTTYRYSDGTQDDNGAMKKSRAIVWKMANPAIGVGGEATGGTDIMEYRYSEILLNVAECYAAQGNTAKCTEYLGKVRTRVGIPQGTNNWGIGTLDTKYKAIEATLYERAIEFAYEGKRSWDMRRWLLYEGGAGFDPRLTAIDGNNIYDPETAWGLGWKIYDGKDGRPNYTKSDNILTKLGLTRFAGTRHNSKIWAYNLGTNYAVQGLPAHPLSANALLTAVPAITRDMTETARNAAFDKLDAFYAGVGMQTGDPSTLLGAKYGMDRGTDVKSQGFLFAWRGWYYVYPLHYDMYNPAKGNSWLTQTVGWMVANATPTGTSSAEQDGTYVYCTPE